MTAPTSQRRRAGRPPGRSGERTRARVLDAALELFGAAGYHATSMSAVAAEAGLSMTGLLHHYPTKEALLTALLERRDVEDAARFADGLSGWEALERMTELVADNATRMPLVRLFVMLSAEAVDPGHPGHAWLLEHHRAARAHVGEALRAGVAAGTVPADLDPDRVARLVVAVMDGLQVQWLASPGEVDMAADFAAFVADLRRR